MESANTGELQHPQLTELQRSYSRIMDVMERERNKVGQFFVEIGSNNLKKQGILPNIVGKPTEDTRALLLTELASDEQNRTIYCIVMTKDGPKGIRSIPRGTKFTFNGFYSREAQESWRVGI